MRSPAPGLRSGSWLKGESRKCENGSSEEEACVWVSVACCGEVSVELVSSIKPQTLCSTSSLFHRKAQPTQPCGVFPEAMSLGVVLLSLLLSRLGEVVACPPAAFEGRCSVEELSEAPQVDTLSKSSGLCHPWSCCSFALVFTSASILHSQPLQCRNSPLAFISAGLPFEFREG